MRQLVFILALVVPLFAQGSMLKATTLMASSITAAGSTYSANLLWANYVAPANMTKWVDPVNGVDAAARDGSSGQPWRTPVYALQRVAELGVDAAGTTITLKAGVYSGQTLVISGNVPSGTASQPITLRAETGASVKFLATSSTSLLTIRKSHWIVEGIQFDMDWYYAPAIRINAPATNVVLRSIHSSNAAAGSSINISADASASFVTDIAVLDSFIGQTLKPDKSKPATGPCGWPIEECATGEVCDMRAGACYPRGDGHGVFVGEGAQRVLLRDNVIMNSSGDGVQCEEGVGGNAEPRDVTTAMIPRDLVMEGNLIYTQDELVGTTENAVDLKACQDVTIRGSAKNPRSSFGQFYSASGTGSNNSNGAAITIHFEARNVLIEETEIGSACIGVSIGRAYDVQTPGGPTRITDSVSDVVVRNNYFVAIGNNYIVFPGRIEGRCEGKQAGVRVNKGDNISILNNTMRHITGKGIVLASGLANSPGLSLPTSSNTKVSSNIIEMAGNTTSEKWIQLTTSEFPSLTSRNNLYWQVGSASTAIFDVNMNATSISAWRGVLENTYGASPTVSATERQLNPLFTPYDGIDTTSTSPARDAAEPGLTSQFCGLADDIGYIESDCTP